MSFTVEQIEQDLAVFRQQKEFFMQQFHQVTGSIAILEQILAKMLAPEPVAEPELPVDDKQHDAEQAQTEHQ